MKIAKNIITMFIGSGLNRILSFLFIFIAARTFTTQQYILYKQIFLLTATVTPLVILGIPISMSYFLSTAKNTFDKDRITLCTIFILFAQSTFIFICLLVFSEQISTIYNNKQLNNYIIYCAIIIFCEAFSSYFTFYMIDRQLPRLVVNVTVIFGIAKLLAIFIIILIKGDLALYLKLYCLIEGLKLLYILAYSFKHFYGKIILKLNWQELINFYHKSIVLGGIQIINSLSKTIDKNIITAQYNNNDYLRYSNGSVELPFISLIVTSQNDILYPVFTKYISSGTEESKKKVLDIWKKSAIVSAFIIFPIATALICFAPTVVTILYSTQYIDCVPIFRIMQIILVFNIIIPGTLYNAFDKSKRFLYITGILLLFKGVIVFTMSLFCSIEIISIVVVILGFIRNFILLNDFSKIFNTNLQEIFPYRQIILLLFLNIFTGSLIFILGLNNLSMWICVCIGIFSVVILYLVQFILLKDLRESICNLFYQFKSKGENSAIKM